MDMYETFLFDQQYGSMHEYLRHPYMWQKIKSIAEVKQTEAISEKGKVYFEIQRCLSKDNKIKLMANWWYERTAYLIYSFTRKILSFRPSFYTISSR